MINFYACVALLMATSFAFSQSSPCHYYEPVRYTVSCGFFNWDTCGRYRNNLRKRSCCSTSSSSASGTCDSGGCPSGTSCRQCDDCSECRSGNNYPSQCPPKCFGEFDCPNGGSCERTDYCSGCNEGYGPPRCDPLCFGSTNCLHGGTCVRHNYCDNCNEGYAPPRCNPVCNPSCLNGGTCIAPNQCRCRTGYSTPRCTAVCNPSCLNGGTCTAPNTCRCRTGYTTPTCTPVCNPSCLNGGTCIAPNQCRCRTGYSTPRCTAVCNPSCLNGGTCTAPNTCRCQTGYTTPTCTPVCNPSCLNGGTCTAPNTCQCQTGYTTPTCTPVCNPSCLNGGTCIAPNQCSCRTGYSTPRCTAVCNPSCLNGGTCTAPNTCRCRTGYTTPTCTPVCNPSCLNGGTCIAPNQCSCRTGYSTPRCTDIDECIDQPSGCHVNADCTNTDGSFQCTCKTGYAGDGLATCTAVNECADGSHGCHMNADCTNTDGSYLCLCRLGYAGDGFTCTDVNECSDISNGCHMNADCTNTVGSYWCTCLAGYTGDGTWCADVNECVDGSNGCHVDAVCTNTQGSYWCTCRAGYTGDGTWCADNEPPQLQVGTCPSDIDEVAEAGMSVKMVTWINPSATDTTGVAPTIVCTPQSGSDFMIDTRDVTCTAIDAAGNWATPNCTFTVTVTDFDECTKEQNECDVNAVCTNTEGSYSCTCTAGYMGDGRTCTDYNECAIDTSVCDMNADCTNLPGSHECSCRAGYTGDGVTCTDDRTTTNAAGKSQTTDTSSNVLTIVISASGLTVTVIVIALVVILARRKHRQRDKGENIIARKQRNKKKRKEVAHEMKGYENRIVGQLSVPVDGYENTAQVNEQEGTDNVATSSANIYEEVGPAPWASRWIIPWSSLVFKKVLGNGHYGEIRKGVVKLQDKVTKLAAITHLEENASAFNTEKFMEEFRAMSIIGKHANIVSILGACLKKDVWYVAWEYLPKGNIHSFLRSNQDKEITTVSPANLFQFALDVAKGMQHIAESGFVHSELSSRNIVLNDDMVAMVTGIGLSKTADIYVETSEVWDPCRCWALESLTNKTFTTMSDVWSFGVVVWEIKSLGQTPYASTESQDLLSMLTTGYRLAKPRRCADEIYNLMLRCWQKDPNKRPNFDQILVDLTAMSRKHKN
ncbi:uncharacterized protein [Asterias amurensis]|uniref:uncharacterized protein n=1 Tax=Asterias amurensis TaxID=7602 RepID=UPI003AB4103B